MDQRIKERTRAEWRELGFFYDLNHSLKEWLLIGSRGGLLRFSELLRAYASNPRREGMSEHDHYGPYMYLKVMTWPHAGIDANTIHGTRDDLRRLASLVEEKVAALAPGDRARIRDEFPLSEYALVMELRDDSFDPASPDGNVTLETG
jgi:hypothetical protein